MILEARLSLNHEALKAQYNFLRKMYGGPDYQRVINTMQEIMQPQEDQDHEPDDDDSCRPGM